MGRNAEAQGWDLVRKAVANPEQVACPSAERLHGEVRRLQTRLEQVQARGGAYRDVDLSLDVRGLLARLESGAALSTHVH